MLQCASWLVVSRMTLASTSLPSFTPNAPTVKLPTINLEPFSGDIESWPRRRGCPPAGGGVTTPHVEKGAGRGPATR